MGNQSLTKSTKSDRWCVANLKLEDRWVRLAMSLRGEFTGGQLVRLAEDALFKMEGMDDLSSSYTSFNWLSGVTSGILYAFRSLTIPRRQALVSELSGRLQSSDMDAVARLAAITVAKLVGKELPAFETNAWIVDIQLTDHSPSNGLVGDSGRPK